MLFNGNTSDKEEFIQASDKLEIEHGDLIRRFYEIIEANRCKKLIPIPIYEEFLSKPQIELTREFFFLNSIHF